MQWSETQTTHSEIENSFFDNQTIDYVYKAKINVIDNDFGGIVIVKKTDSLKHRVVFATEFGNTIFDFTITPTSYEVNSIMEQIDKKILVKMLALDFQTLISKGYKVDKQYENKNELILNTKVGKRQHYYFYPKSSDGLRQINTSKKGKGKTLIVFKKVQYGIAHKIDIEHQNIEMNMDLEFIGVVAF